MKKLLIAAALTGVAAGAFAQGTVLFNNNALTQPAIVVNPGNTLAPANGFTVALYWVNQSSGSFAPINLLTATPVTTFHGQYNGGFDAGSTIIAGKTADDGIGEFEVAGWLGTTFTSYAAAVAGNDKVGSGTPFYNATGGSTGGGAHPGDPAPNLTGWAGQPDLVLSSTPEPTTIALGGLGAAALLLFRRRK